MIPASTVILKPVENSRGGTDQALRRRALHRTRSPVFINAEPHRLRSVRDTSLFFFVAVLLAFGGIGCAPSLKTIPAAETISVEDKDNDATEIVQMIVAANGSVERLESGAIVGIDLAKERDSVTDLLLHQAMTLPSLVQLRVAGSEPKRETFLEITAQKSLEELYLQDAPLDDADLVRLVTSLPRLRRLTLRRLADIGDEAVAEIAAKTKLRSLALIEMNVSRTALEAVADSETLAALDLRHCSRFVADDYRLLAGMPRLTDLKIGGFAVGDDVLSVLPTFSRLKGLTIEETMVTPDGFAAMAHSGDWTTRLELLVLGRNAALTDASLHALRAFPKLKRLSVRYMMVTGSFLEELATDAAKRPKLESLSLAGTLTTDETIRALRAYRELKRLDLSAVPLDSSTLPLLAALESLEELDLSGTELDAQALDLLRSMKSLRQLKYGGGESLVIEH